MCAHRSLTDVLIGPKIGQKMVRKCVETVRRCPETVRDLGLKPNKTTLIRSAAALFYREGPGDRVGLAAEQAEAVFGAREAEHVDGRVICLEKIEAAAHVLAAGDVFEIEYGPTESAREVLFLTRDVALAEFQAIFFGRDHVSHDRVPSHAEFAYLEVAVGPVAIYVLDVWAGRRGFDVHFPDRIRQLESVFYYRVAKRIALRNGRNSRNRDNKN